MDYPTLMCSEAGAAPSRQDVLVRKDVCAAFRRASRALTQLYNLVLVPTGLKATQFIALQAIAAHGEVAQWQLAVEREMAVETLSRQLATLRKAGLVVHRTGSTRPGERLHRLTPTGIAKLQDALPYWERAQERVRMVIGETEWGALLAAADQITAAARKAEHLRLPARPLAKAAAATTGDAISAGITTEGIPLTASPSPRGESNAHSQSDLLRLAGSFIVDDRLRDGSTERPNER